MDTKDKIGGCLARRSEADAELKVKVKVDLEAWPWMRA